MEHIEFKTQGVCARSIEIDVENNIIQSARFVGGCPGNTQGIAALLVGMTVDEAIKRLSGLRCGFKPTSCPDQLATALKEHYQKNA